MDKLEKLYCIADAEYKALIKTFENSTVEEMVNNALKISMYQLIKHVIRHQLSVKTFSDETINYLITLDEPIFYIYSEWLDMSTSEAEEIVSIVNYTVKHMEVRND